MAPPDLSNRMPELYRVLAARGPTPARELLEALGVSQPTLSRLVRKHAADLLVVGRARATRYALRRNIPDVGRVVPVYEVLDDGASRELLKLHAVAPEGFFVEPLAGDVDERFYDDLPYFSNDARPAGFLGRLVPAQHPELGVPRDIARWSAAHTLAWWTRYGWDLPGNLVVGEAAFQLYLAQLASPDTVDARRRKATYPTLAERILEHGPPGSSAAGEHPKFLARLAPGPRHVLVKFSPVLRGPVEQRHADLLVAEHLALEVLARHRSAAAKSRLFRAGERVFLEIERFDRTKGGGRRGVISLTSLEAEFVGGAQSWTEGVEALEQQDRVPSGCSLRVRLLERFGRLIANTDMHFGNISFFSRGERILDLAPAYDMLPMLYAPQQGNLPKRTFTAPSPEPGDAPIWEAACRAAADFWTALSEHDWASDAIRRIAAGNASIVRDAARLSRHLPGASG